MEKIFKDALGISEPWYIKSIEFDRYSKRLDICLDFRRGAKFMDDGNGGDYQEYTAYDTTQKEWRHLNFFEHECYLHARTPRIKRSDGRTRVIMPPWSGVISGFTLLFEALIIQLCKGMPVHQVAALTNVSDHKIWRMLDIYVNGARQHENHENVKAVGMDETSVTKGHDYITLFVDMEERKTMYIADGKDHTTVEDFVNDFKEHKGDVDNIKDVSCDMSPAFIKGVKKSLPNGRITFDKFHIIKIINKAVDAVRKEEVKTQECLKGARYSLLKNEGNLTVKQKKIKEALCLSKKNLKTVRAMHIREAFQEIYKAETIEEFALLLKDWYYWATHSQLEPMKKAAKTIKRHWKGVLQWKESQINNGILEGLNSVVQAAKRKARGYKVDHFKTIAYLLTGKLDFSWVNKYCKPI